MWRVGECADPGRHAELLERRDLTGDQAQREPEAAPLMERIAAEARLPLPPEGEVDFALDLELVVRPRTKAPANQIEDLF